MSQVKNLRAMFENKGETSPPDRGRSPGLPSTGTESPRPLSKVRTSFIAVEKDGRMGLQRGESSDSVSSWRKFSVGTEGETPSLDRTNSFASRTDFESRKNLAQETIPESPKQDSKPTMANTTSANTEARSTQADQRVNGGGNGTRQTPGTPVARGLVKSNGPVAQIDGTAEKSNKVATDTKKTNTPSKEPARASAANKPAPKLAPISTSAKTTSKPAKSLAALKTPTSATKPPAKATPKSTGREVSQPAKKAAPQEPQTTPRANSSVLAAQKPSPVSNITSGIGFVKPKPKSPTRPVQLPAGLMTHTASSVSKVNAPRQTLSRASGSIPSLQPSGRPPSRTSISTAGTGSRPLKRQSSVINRPRPSIGPPPKQLAKDHPLTSGEKELDQGFLARMMRPTQSSSSKTLDRIVTTPPRKVSGLVKKTIVRHSPKTQSDQAVKGELDATQESEPAGAIGKAAPSAANEIAPVVEQMASAESAIAAAKEAEGTVDVPLEAVPEPTNDASEESLEPASEHALGPGEPTAEAPAETQETEEVGDESEVAPVNGDHHAEEPASETAEHVNGDHLHEESPSKPPAMDASEPAKSTETKLTSGAAAPEAERLESFEKFEDDTGVD